MSTAKAKIRRHSFSSLEETAKSVSKDVPASKQHQDSSNGPAEGDRKRPIPLDAAELNPSAKKLDLGLNHQEPNSHLQVSEEFLCCLPAGQYRGGGVRGVPFVSSRCSQHL